MLTTILVILHIALTKQLQEGGAFLGSQFEDVILCDRKGIGQRVLEVVGHAASTVQKQKEAEAGAQRPTPCL